MDIWGANEAAERLDRDAAMRTLGTKEERDRLRPLLERSLRIAERYDPKLPLVADLRRELGKAD